MVPRWTTCNNFISQASIQLHSTLPIHSIITDRVLHLTLNRKFFLYQWLLLPTPALPSIAPFFPLFILSTFLNFTSLEVAGRELRMKSMTVMTIIMYVLLRNELVFFSLCLHLLTICLSHRLLRLIHRNGCAPAELLRRQLHLLSRFLPPERFHPRTTKFPHCIATRLLRTPHSASALASYSSRPRSIEPTQ